MQTLKEIRDEFLSNLNKENNFETLTAIDKKFDEKVSRLIFVIKRMENKVITGLAIRNTTKNNQRVFVWKLNKEKVEEN